MVLVLLPVALEVDVALNRGCHQEDGGQQQSLDALHLLRTHCKKNSYIIEMILNYYMLNYYTLQIRVY